MPVLNRRVGIATRPLGPPKLNSDSWQSKNLVLWFPYSGGGGMGNADYIENYAPGQGKISQSPYSGALTGSLNNEVSTRPLLGVVNWPSAAASTTTGHAITTLPGGDWTNGIGGGVTVSVWLSGSSGYGNIFKILNGNGVYVLRPQGEAGGNFRWWGHNGSSWVWVEHVNPGFVGSQDTHEIHHYAAIARMVSASNCVLELWYNGRLVAGPSASFNQAAGWGEGATFHNSRIGDETQVLKSADLRIYNKAFTEAEIWALYDPKTRWDLYAKQPRVVGRAPTATIQQVGPTPLFRTVRTV